VSVDAAGNEGDGDSMLPSISADGNCVAFESKSTNLSGDDTMGYWQCYVKDVASGQVEMVSKTSTPQPPQAGNGDSFEAWISGNGNCVSFSSRADNLDPEAADTNHLMDVYLRNRTANTMMRLSKSSAGEEGDGDSYDSTINWDGTLATFNTGATNLNEIDADSNGMFDIYVKECQPAGIATRESLSTTRAPGDEHSLNPMMTHDGRFVVFQSRSSTFDTADTNGTWDVFVRDLELALTHRMSQSPDGGSSNGRNDHPAISPDGLYAGWSAVASNLVVNDVNGARDAVIRGPGLTLEIDKPFAVPGDTVTLETWRGEVGDPASLFLVGVDGAPIFLKLKSSKFTIFGDFVVSSALPNDAGLIGHVYTFRTWGFAPYGKVLPTNPVDLEIVSP
jgi:hypothetical protein